MGGSENVFQTTCWIDVRKVRTSDEAQRKAIVNDLLGKYWKPVYCYLRRKGYDNEKAKDLTQGFFHEIVLGQELIQKADQSIGRFRTFLLASLEHYVANMYRKETAKKRMPEGGVVHFGDIDDFNDRNVSTTATAEEAFHYTWASNLLDEAISTVKNECCGTGKEGHWRVFEEKVLAPILNNTPVPSLTQICGKYDIDSPAMASNMLITVKRRFKAVLRRQLHHFVSSEAEVVDEFNDLLEILSKSCAR